MFDFLHNFHLILDLLINYAILHEVTFVELLGSIWRTIILGSDLVDRCEGSPTNDVNTSVFLTTPEFAWSLPESRITRRMLRGFPLGEGYRKQINLLAISIII